MTLLQEDDVLFDDFDQSYTQITQLGEDLHRIEAAADAISMGGINPTTLHILRSQRLLTGTSYDAIALESFPSEPAGGVESDRALEALNDSFKEKAAQYSAKILAMVGQGANKIWAVIKSLGDKIGSLIKSAGDKVWDKTKEVGAAVKAHPYKTCVIVLSAIAAVATIMIYSASNLPGAGQTRQVYRAFSDKIAGMMRNIPNPFGKVNASVGDASNFRVDVVFPSRSAAAIPVEKLGWNYHAAKAIGVQVDKTVSAFKSGMSQFGTKVYRAAASGGHMVFRKAEAVKKAVPGHVYALTGSREAAHASSFAAGGIYYGLLISLTYAVWRLVRRVVVGGLSLIYSSIRSVFASQNRL